MKRSFEDRLKKALQPNQEESRSRKSKEPEYVYSDFHPPLKKHTKREMEIALDVVSTSSDVVSWAIGIANFIGVDLKTEEGQKWFYKNCRKRARSHIAQGHY